jgi:nucleotide-binding universal stress UspA family protein
MSTTRRRRSYEAGHKPKWLVVIDDTEECDRAVYFAARRAARVGAGVIMLRVIETHDRNQQWAGVADIMKAEAHEEANAALDKYATRANGMAGITPERVVREGTTADEILGLIEDDEDIAILVLAAASDKEGPGPLVAGLSKNAGDFPIPVAVVPSHLSDEDLDSMS